MTAASLLAATLLAVSGAAPSRAAELRGMAVYRERIALPPGAVFEATLEDVSKEGAAATLLGRTRIELAGQPPIRFQIAYDAARVDVRHAYAVHARITLGNELLFDSESAPVLTRGNGPAASLILVRAGGGGRGSKSRLGRLPADFAGTLPCTDCAGITYRLRLLPDGAYMRQSTYLRSGHDVSFYDLGRWSYSPDGNTLVLRGGQEVPTMFSVRNANTLRKLDSKGREIASRSNYDLRRSEWAVTFEPRLKMRGMYQYAANAGTFTECMTGLRWAVAQEADNAALRSAYLKHRRPGAEVLVTVYGRVAMRPGGGQESALVVERLAGIWPGETCGARPVTPDLEGTHWRLTRLGGDPVTVSGQQREPYLVLEAKTHRFAGFTGCNRMFGSFQRAGNSLRFGAVGMTRMSCPGDNPERRFVKALEATRTWRVVGPQLVLFGDGGRMTARLEAQDQ